MRELLSTQTQIPARRLSDEEVQHARVAIEEARQLRQAILKRRKGKLVPSSAALIRRAREERSREL